MRLFQRQAVHPDLLILRWQRRNVQRLPQHQRRLLKDDPRAREGSPVQVDVLGWALRLVLVFVFVAAVFGKLRAGRAGLTELAATVRRLGVREGRAHPVAVVTIVVEAGAAVLTAWPATAVAGCAAALVLLVGFTGAISRLVASGSGARCRCFGGAATPLGKAHVVRNATLASVALAALVVTGIAGTAITAPVLVLLAFLAAVPAGVFVFWDDLAALRSSPGRKV